MAIYVACSGFPIPVGRYFTEFNAVEISDTELGIPGAGTTRRWLREAPEGSTFTVLAPRQIADSGFALNEKNAAALKEIGRFAKMIKAIAVVFSGGLEFGPSRTNRANLRDFFQSLPRGLPHPVVDMPVWPVSQVESALKNPAITLAYDPLKEEPQHIGNLAYLRLPGPSGYRSRYDDEAMDKIIAYCRASRAKDIFCVFRNSDRCVNARRALAELAGPK